MLWIVLREADYKRQGTQLANQLEDTGGRGAPERQAGAISRGRGV